jgi:hypothetical protein
MTVQAARITRFSEPARPLMQGMTTSVRGPTRLVSTESGHVTQARLNSAAEKITAAKGVKTIEMTSIRRTRDD